LLQQASTAKGLSAVAESFARQVPDPDGRTLFEEAFVMAASLAHADHALGWGSAGTVDEITVTALAQSKDTFTAITPEHQTLVDFAMECGLYFGVNDLPYRSNEVLRELGQITSEVFGVTG
jgi:hypothetical protein